MTTKTAQLGVVVESAAQARLQAARELLVGWPALFRTSLSSVDVGYNPARRLVMAIAHFEPDACGPEVQARFNFWAVHFGGKPFSLTRALERERTAFVARLKSCPNLKENVAPGDLATALGELSLEATGPNRRSNTRFQVELEVDLGGVRASTFDVSEGGIFVRSPTAPPIGDVVGLALSIPGVDAPFSVEGKISHVRQADAKGHPAGFGISFVSPRPELREAILRHVASSRSPRLQEDRRADARIDLRLPVQVLPIGTTAALPGRAPRPVAPPREELRMDLSASDHFEREYSENLSMGGAFVRTRSPLPVKTPVRFVANLPDGRVLEANGMVVHTQADGVGLQLDLDATARSTLESVFTAMSPPPSPRALIIDDDALLRTMLRDDLTERGFEVLTAADARSGLSLLFDELLLVDVVLTDLRMPGMNGDALISLLRRGGEKELCLVLMTSGVTAEMNSALTAAGADLVLDKGEGPQAVAARVQDLVDLRRSQQEVP